MDRISIFWNLPALKRKHHKCCHRLNTMQVVIPVPWKITPQKGWFPFTTQSGSYSTHFNKSSPISSTQHITPTGHQHFTSISGWSRGTFLPGAPNSCAPAPAPAPHRAVIPPSRRARRRGASQAGCAHSRAIASSQRRQRGAMGGGSPRFFWGVLDD